MSILTHSLHWHGQVYKFMCKHGEHILTPCAWFLFYPIPSKLLTEKDIPNTPALGAAPLMEETPLLCSQFLWWLPDTAAVYFPRLWAKGSPEHHSYPRRDSSSWAEASCKFWASAVRGSFFWKAKIRWVFICCSQPFSLVCFRSLWVPLPSRKSAEGKELSL